MALITIKEYAEKHGKHHVTVAQKCQRGGFQTAKKIGRDWLIDADEPYNDHRVTSGKYKNWRKKEHYAKYAARGQENDAKRNHI